MAIQYHPAIGQVLSCDFSQGFSAPEMVKRRPVIVLAPSMTSRPGLATVVCCSSMAPEPVMQFHMVIEKRHLPMINWLQRDTTWLKGDMVYAVGFHRLDWLQLGHRGSDGSRVYFRRPLPLSVMNQVHRCVLHGMGLERAIPCL